MEQLPLGLAYSGVAGGVNGGMRRGLTGVTETQGRELHRLKAGAWVHFRLRSMLGGVRTGLTYSRVFG